MTGTIIGFLFVLLPSSSPSPLERGDQEFARINYAPAEADLRLCTCHADRFRGCAVALAPGVIRHHFALGELFMEQGRYREARERFRVVLTLPILLASDERTRFSAAALIQNMEED